MDINEKLENVLSDHTAFHSKIQMDSFITVRAGGSKFGQYQQALQELYNRCKSIKESYAQRALIKIDIEELSNKKKLFQNRYDRERDKIKLGTYIMNLQDHEFHMKHLEREFRHFFAQAVALKDDAAKETEVDKWVYNIKSQAVLDLLSNGRLSASVLNMIQCLPMDTRKELCSGIINQEQHQKLVDWYFEQENQIPKMELEDYDIKDLLGVSVNRQHGLFGNSQPAAVTAPDS